MPCEQPERKSAKMRKRVVMSEKSRGTTTFSLEMNGHSSRTHNEDYLRKATFLGDVCVQG